ncbi:phosphatase [Lentilactobacillus curieae]|uniref:Phosphatase n=1 Tax=Lentilactobacillus curieae TaxID=1138822 RepID=A0A1S6QFS6_9LACO|nr:tyrosine-protein phosphatase [Lentilactobacillus curieae]AQW20466.1 phosphatase [Lentilactobacillus curieae]
MTLGITNFRSLGGYTSGASTFKADKLFRSGQLSELSADQTEYLENQLKIKRIVDMRGEDERAQFPDTQWPGSDYQVIDILKDATKNNASLGKMITNGGNVYDNMMLTYEQLAVSDSAINGYRQFLTSVSDDDSPLVFHCFAGKDRTGVAAALILKSVGVSEEQIYADYLKTNELRKSANEEILKGLKDQATSEQLESISVALNVNADYLEHFFDTAVKQAGGFQDYLYTTLKLDEGFEERMREMYLK